ncbi:MAG: MBL fold metallo-hydrolase, partial [Acidobacteriota bacterium]
LAIPLMGIAQLAGMVVVPLAVVSTSAASVAGALAHVGAAGLVWSADLVRFIPQATFRVAPPGWTSVGLYYAGLVWGWTGRPGARVAWLTAALAGVWMVAEPWAWRAAQGDGRLHVTFLDVGQGDSAFVRFPHGATMLVDAGGVGRSSSFDIGDRVVAPVLRDAGVRRLDYLVVSHGDPDHIGGAAAIVREFRPREVWEGIPVPSFGPLVALRQESQSVGARWANVYDTDHLRVDDVEITARHPRRAEWERRRVRNDDSLVLELVWRDVSLLFTGDIGAPVERTLAPGGTGTGLQVLKVPHHGSLTSSSREFLQHLAPDAAIVSAGRANHFGHPAPDVLSRYAEIGTAIFRTDLDGAVVLDTDGHTLDLRAFTGRNLVVPGAQAHHDHGP